MTLKEHKLTPIVTFSCLILTAISFASCSRSDYINSIPGESTALVSMDLGKMNNTRSQNLLKETLHVDDLSDCGLDVKSKLYMFESPEGNFGLCAKVNDKDKVEQLFSNLYKGGFSGEPMRRRGFSFSILYGTLIAGVSDNALIIMGPATVSEQPGWQNKIAEYLNQNEEEGIKGTQMFDCVDSMSSPVAIVAQAKALPEMFAAPFTLGAPKDADPSQVLISAGVSVNDNCLAIQGKSFSYDMSINQSLHDALKVFRPIKGKYVQVMSSDLLGGMFVNVDGSKFLPLIQDNSGLQALLTGINTAIDLDNIIKSINGDMLISVSADTQVSLNAELGNSAWLKDIGYWKQSCPQGSHIYDWQKDAYYYTNGKTTFYFGVAAGNQLYSGGTAAHALASLRPATHPIPESVQKQITGKKMVILMNIDDSHNPLLRSFRTYITPIFGKISNILYIIN